MKIDLYAKVILTVIAVCLVLLVAGVWSRPTEVKAEQAKVVNGFLSSSGGVLYRVWDSGAVDYLYLTRQTSDIEKEADKRRPLGLREFDPRWYTLR